jgi:hypothetical protein
MFEIAFDAWYKAMDFQCLKAQSLNFRKGGKVAHSVGAERLRHEPSTCVMPLLHPDFFYEGNQA